MVDDAADPAEGFVAGSVDGEDEATRDQEQSWLPGVGMGIPSPVPPLSMSAGRSARSSGVAGHGLVQVAEGLLDAGVEVVRTPGAVLACSCWFGRWLGQPCPGLVGDRAGLVALGALKAIVEVWRRGVGHGDCPGSRSGRAVRPAPRSGGVRGARLEQLYLLPRAGSSRPAGDVTARQISPGIYGERCPAVAAGRLASEADGD